MAGMKVLIVGGGGREHALATDSHKAPRSNQFIHARATQELRC